MHVSLWPLSSSDSARQEMQKYIGIKQNRPSSCSETSWVNCRLLSLKIFYNGHVFWWTRQTKGSRYLKSPRALRILKFIFSDSCWNGCETLNTFITSDNKAKNKSPAIKSSLIRGCFLQQNVKNVQCCDVFNENIIIEKRIAFPFLKNCHYLEMALLCHTSWLLLIPWTKWWWHNAANKM